MTLTRKEERLIKALRKARAAVERMHALHDAACETAPTGPYTAVAWTRARKAYEAGVVAEDALFAAVERCREGKP